MTTKQAIISFSQSDKVKSGLIWCSQVAQLIDNLPPDEQNGAVKVLRNLIAMVANEVHLARQASGNAIWLEVDKILNTARVMVDSGVSLEAVHHLTQALTQVNRIGQTSMKQLIDEGLLQ